MNATSPRPTSKKKNDADQEALKIYAEDATGIHMLLKEVCGIGDSDALISARHEREAMSQRVRAGALTSNRGHLAMKLNFA